MRPLTRFILIILLSSLGIATPNARAETWRVGVIMTADNHINRQTYQALHATLRELQYAADKLQLQVQHPHADVFSWANSARRAKAAGFTALVTIGMPLTRVALRETSGLPVIYAGVFSPLSAPLAGFQPLSKRALENSAGICSEVPLATLVRAFAQIYGGGTITALFHENDLDATYQLAQLQRAAAIYDVQVKSRVLGVKDFPATLAGIEATSDAFFVSDTVFSDRELTQLLNRLDALQRPLLGYGYGLAEQGALVSIEVDAHEQGTAAARYLVRYLQGQPLASMAPLKPKRVELVFNLVTAKRLDLKVPFDTLTAATRIIR